MLNHVRYIVNRSQFLGIIFGIILPFWVSFWVSFYLFGYHFWYHFVHVHLFVHCFMHAHVQHVATFSGLCLLYFLKPRIFLIVLMLISLGFLRVFLLFLDVFLPVSFCVHRLVHVHLLCIVLCIALCNTLHTLPPVFLIHCPISDGFHQMLGFDVFFSIQISDCA